MEGLKRKRKYLKDGVRPITRGRLRIIITDETDRIAQGVFPSRITDEVSQELRPECAGEYHMRSRLDLYDKENFLRYAIKCLDSVPEEATEVEE